MLNTQNLSRIFVKDGNRYRPANGYKLLLWKTKVSLGTLMISVSTRIISKNNFWGDICDLIYIVITPFFCTQRTLQQQILIQRYKIKPGGLMYLESNQAKGKHIVFSSKQAIQVKIYESSEVLTYWI